MAACSPGCPTAAGLDADQLHCPIVRRTDKTCPPRCCRRRRRPRPAPADGRVVPGIAPGVSRPITAWKSRTIRGNGMRPHHRAEAVMRGFHGAHPVADGLVDRVAQRSRAAVDRPHLGPQELHAEDVGPLAADVFLAHVDHALETETGAGRGGGHAVLAGAGLGDDAPLAHPPGQAGPGRACC